MGQVLACLMVTPISDARPCFSTDVARHPRAPQPLKPKSPITPVTRNAGKRHSRCPGLATEPGLRGNPEPGLCGWARPIFCLLLEHFAQSPWGDNFQPRRSLCGWRCMKNRPFGNPGKFQTHFAASELPHQPSGQEIWNIARDPHIRAVHEDPDVPRDLLRGEGESMRDPCYVRAAAFSGTLPLNFSVPHVFTCSLSRPAVSIVPRDHAFQPSGLWPQALVRNNRVESSV